MSNIATDLVMRSTVMASRCSGDIQMFKSTHAYYTNLMGIPAIQFKPTRNSIDDRLRHFLVFDIPAFGLEIKNIRCPDKSISK